MFKKSLIIISAAVLSLATFAKADEVFLSSKDNEELTNSDEINLQNTIVAENLYRNPPLPDGPRLPGGTFPRFPIPACAIDPSIANINFSIVRRDSQFRGAVKITAQIKNIGNRTYTTNPNQQAILLYENNRMVANQPFGNLLPNQTAEVSLTRNWDASSPSEGEFPPNYRAMIVYDPDIYMDGNPLNDDCNSANNDRSRSGTEINALFR